MPKYIVKEDVKVINLEIHHKGEFVVGGKNDKTRNTWHIKRFFRRSWA